MRWPWAENPELESLRERIGELETRADTSYTDALVAALQKQAQGRVRNPASPTATGALETCAGLIGRAFAAAEIGGPDSITRALSPSLMALIGRSLIRKGEIVFRIDTSGGALSLTPAQTHNVSGGPDPATWGYELHLPGPSESVSVELTAASVLHFVYAVDPDTPWKGIGPIQVAYLAGELSAETLKALADESSGPRGSFLPLPGTDGDDDTTDELKADVKTAHGDMLTVESMGDAFEGGRRTARGRLGSKAIWTEPPGGND